jgi:sugar phosphate permease
VFLTALDYATTSDATRPAARFARVVPLAFVTYALAFLDRQNYGYAESRLRADLHLTTQVSSFVAGVFFLGYFALQIPGAAYASRRSLKWLVFWALILWGVLSGLPGVLRSVPLLIADRVLLGAVEGVVLPAMLIYLTRWFTRSERSRASSLLILANPITMAFASVLCGSLIAWFDAHRVGSLAGWQMMFIIEGVPSLVWAGFWLALAAERPSEARWLTAPEIEVVQERLDAEQRDLSPVRNYRAAFADRRVVMLAAMYFFFSASSYGLTMWLPQIVEEGTKRGVAAAGLLTAIPYLLAVFSMLIVSYLSDRTLKRKPFVWGSMAVGCAAFTAARLAGPNHFWLAFLALIVVCSCLYTPCGPLWAWMGDILPSNVVGESMALVNSIGALGGWIGINFVGNLKSHFHSTGPAFIFLAASFALGAILALSVRTKPQVRRAAA